MAGPERMLTPEEVAEMLRISPKTLSNWRSKHRGPPAFRYGGVVRYSEAKVLAWCEEFTQENPDPGSHARTSEPFSLRRRRAVMAGKHRLGGYRTQRDRRAAAGGEGPKVDIALALESIKNRPE